MTDKHILRNTPPKPIVVGGADRAVRSTGPAKLKTKGSVTAPPSTRVTTSKRGAR